MDIIPFALHYFKVVARHEHITNAAEELHISQPALSKAITRLEESLGTKLFDRDNNKIRLNFHGRMFLRHVDRIFIELDDAHKEIQESEEHKVGDVRVGVSMPNVLYNFLERFMIKNPDIHIYQRIMSAREMKPALEEGDIDIGIAFLPIESHDIRWEPLFSERIGVMVPNEHPLLKKENVHLKELENERFYSNNATEDLHELTLKFCGLAGFSPNIFFEGNEPDLVGNLVSKGYGVSFVSEPIREWRKDPRHPSFGRVENATRFLRIEEPVCLRTTGVVTHRQRALSTPARMFYNAVVADFLQKPPEL